MPTSETATLLWGQYWKWWYPRLQRLESSSSRHPALLSLDLSSLPPLSTQQTLKIRWSLSHR